MTFSSQEIWEDDEYVYIPEELFKHLPPEYREAAEESKERGNEILKIADKDIQNLIRLANAFPTVASLRYIFHRLRNTKFELNTESYLDQEILTTAFIVTYSRLFVSGTGGAGVSRDQIPAHLLSVHDDIIDIRHKRYAHNGGHETIGTGLQLGFDGADFHIKMQMTLGFYINGRNEWAELIAFIDAHMHDRLQKILGRLKTKTGCEWVFPNGPAPNWVDNES